MLESFPVAILVGILLGFLSGLGIGGGSLLIVWLTAVLEWNIQEARAVNLLFFLPAALIACFIRFRRGTLNWKAVIPATLSGCVFAVAGSIIASWINTDTLQKLFGILLLLAGAKELFYRERKAK